MQRHIEISWNHGNVDLALEKLSEVVEQGARHDQIQDAAQELGQAFSGLFAAEARTTSQAEEMFGEGIGEVRELFAMRSRIWSLLEDVKAGESLPTTIAELRKTFDDYRDAEWGFIRSYSGLMRPGTEGA